MKYTILILTFYFFNQMSFAQNGPKFNVKFSEPFAVYEFVKNLSTHYPDNSYKQLFLNSEYNTKRYTDLITEFDTLNVYHFYKYENYPYGQKMPGVTLGLLRHNLIESKSFEEFKRLSIGIIPNEQLIRFTGILTDFLTIYRTLVYSPSKEKFEQQLQKISSYVIAKNIASYFQMGLNFYNSSWDGEIPFDIALFPSSNKQGFSAEAILNNAMSEIPSDLDNYNILMSVLSHEIFHILYDEQALNVKVQIKKWFISSRSANSQYAYLLLNEALATALGNGYVYEQLSGNVDETDWYNRKYINLMARKIYPLLKLYIHDKKSIDKQFVDEYIKTYDENFSAWTSELDNILAYRYLLTENADDFDYINQNYRYRSIYQSQYPISENGIKEMSETPITKVVIVSTENNYKLELVKKYFPELNKWKFDASQEFVHSILLTDKTYLIIINKINSSIQVLFDGLKSDLKKN